MRILLVEDEQSAARMLAKGLRESAIAVVLVILSYTLAGIPFLNVRVDAVARVLHFIEFFLICAFVLYALAQIWRDNLGGKSKNKGFRA